MVTNKLYSAQTLAVVMLVLLSAVFLASGSLAHAQSVYTAPNGTAYNIPAGYQAYNYGTFYNSSIATYFDPVTGQTSTVAPTGPEAVPAGYSASVFGTYFNPTTGTYLDPAAGFTSTVAPTGPSPIVTSGTTGTTVTSNPALPDTGAGGNADVNIAVLALAALVAIGGVATLRSSKAAFTK